MDSSLNLPNVLLIQKCPINNQTILVQHHYFRRGHFSFKYSASYNELDWYRCKLSKYKWQAETSTTQKNL